jgi:hypothetical protein
MASSTSLVLSMMERNFTLPSLSFQKSTISSVRDEKAQRYPNPHPGRC